MLLLAEYSAIVNLNGFEKAKMRWEKYFKIMVKLVQMCNFFVKIFGYNAQMSYIYIEFKTK